MRSGPRRIWIVGRLWFLVALCADLRAESAGLTPGVVSLPAGSQSLQFIRIARKHLSGAPQAAIDPCAFEAAGAVLTLSEKEILALTVPFERLGSVKDHIRRFRPAKTMAMVGVPSVAKLLGEPLAVPSFGAAARVADGLQFDRYHTPQEGVAFFQHLAASHPQIARLISIGQSVEGRDLWALKLSDSPDEAEPQEQAIVFCGVHHAREWATHELMLYLAEYLATHYESDLRIRHVLDNSVVWLVLAVNPDGLQFCWDEDRLWRKNRRDNGGGRFGIDLNRNYAYRWGFNASGSSGNPNSETYRGPSAASEPETQAMQAFLAEQTPAIAVAYHTYSQLVLYPFGFSPATNPESYTSMRAIAAGYADAVRHVHGMDYAAGVMNYTLYSTNGDFNDFAYGAHGIMAYSPELRPASLELGGFLLPEDQILANNVENLAAALRLMDIVAGPQFFPAPDGLFSAGTNPFSLPLTPVNQKPESALGMDTASARALSAWHDDVAHITPYFSYYPDFEGVGCGSAYRFDYSATTAAWADGFTGYTALPRVFEHGAHVMLENFAPRPVLVGIPGDRPVRLRDLRIVKRTLASTGNDLGTAELILESRTALEDMSHSPSWISWQWTATAANGSVRRSHPLGLDGADEFVHPFSVYSFASNVPSFGFWSDDPSLNVYLLEFPPPLRADADGDGDADAADFAEFLSCFTGPAQSLSSQFCQEVDLDHDFDVDIIDFALVQAQFGTR